MTESKTRWSANKKRIKPLTSQQVSEKMDELAEQSGAFHVPPVGEFFKRKYPLYQIVQQLSVHELSRIVQEELEKGWEVSGGVAVWNMEKYGTFFLQTLIKR